MGIDTRDQIEILKYYKKFLTMKESSYFSVEVQKWKKCFEIIPLEERPSTAISDLAGSLQPSDISSYSQDLYRSSYYPREFEVFLVNALPGRPLSALRHLKLQKPVYNDQRTLEWPRDAPYS